MAHNERTNTKHTDFTMKYFHVGWLRLVFIACAIRSCSAERGWMRKIKTLSPFHKNQSNQPASKSRRIFDEEETISSRDVFVDNGVSSYYDEMAPAPNRPWWQMLPLDMLGKCAQFGLMTYLAFFILKAATEAIEEFWQEISGMESSGFSNDQIDRAIQFLEQPHEEAKAQLERANAESGSGEIKGSLHLPTLQIAQKLVLAGLPLRTSTDTEGNISASLTSKKVDKPSVETVLPALSRSEVSLLQQCLWTPSVHQLKSGKTTTWNDIVGLDRVKSGLMSSLRTTIGNNPSRAYDSLFENSPTQGILLYGPPGCGKSFLIKALSTVSRIPCLVVSPSVLLRKYVGETNQQCRALFSLAQKLAPCILVIDEVDGLFRERSESEHEVSRDLKTEFLQNLDGMMSSSSVDASGRKRNIIVVAATNRPFDVDSAILRRLGQSYFVSMPDVASRAMIMRHLLRSVPKDRGLDTYLLSTRTEGYSPSDLKQLLQKAASSGPLQESPANPPPLTTEHILQAMNSVPPTPLSPQYCWALAKFVRSQNPERVEQVPDFSQGSSNSIISWESDYGTFYHLGALEIDRATFEHLEELAEKLVEESFEEDDDDDDDGHEGRD